MLNVLKNSTLLLVMLWTQQSTAQHGLSAELAQMMTLFKGEFDNFQQVHKEKEDKYPHIHEHIHSIFAPVEVPAFGKNVFYVKQYMDGNPSKIYRQRLYSFSEDTQEKAIRLDIYSFKVDSLFYDAHLKPEMLSGLKPEQLSVSPGCEVFWKKQDEEFIGYMKPKACNFISKRSGKKIFITDSLKLNKNEIWIRDEAEDENGQYVFGHKEKIPHKLKRTHLFKGWYSLERPDKPGEFIAARDLRLHDQGGRQWVTDNGQKTKYWFELSNVIYGKDLVVLKLALYEESKEKSIAYTWATPGSRNIGINLRWFSAGLTAME
jgi:CpeT/CpcT family (DUF1001)